MSRVAVVTGAASGMGLAIGQRLAERGHRVALLDRDGDAAEQAAEKLRGRRGSGDRRRGRRRPTAPPIDARCRQVRGEFGPIEIIVTSAGIDEFTKFTDITAEAWDRMIAVNLTGTFHCLQAAVPDMLAGNWGRIVTISSSSAQSGAARMAHYVASKGGVIGLTKSLALELAPHGITVNTDPARVHRHPDGAPRRGARRPAGPQRGDRPHPGAAGRHPRRHRRRRARSCAPRTPATSPVRRINVNGGWYLCERRATASAIANRAARIAPAPPRVLGRRRARRDRLGACPTASKHASCRPARMRCGRRTRITARFMHHPALTGPWLRYNAQLLQRPALDPRHRELIVLRVAWRRRRSTSGCSTSGSRSG